MTTHRKRRCSRQRLVQRIVPLLALVSVVPAAVFGQETVRVESATERRARNRPLLRVRSEIPTAPTVQLKFVSDETGSVWLYAGGLDKIVRRWRIVTNDDRRLQFDQSFKWPVFRGIRGRINAIDVFADAGGSQHLATGGFGSKSSLVSLLSLDDPTSTQILFDLGTAARQVIWSLTFDPEGKFVIAGEGKRPGNAPANLALWSVGDKTSRLSGRTSRLSGEASRLSGGASRLSGEASRLSGGRLQVSCTASELREVRYVAVNPTGTHVAAAGLAMNGDEYLIEIWKLETLASALRAPGRSLVQKMDPVRTVRIRSRWERTIRGLAWSDRDTWIAGTILGLVVGDIGDVTNLAGFAGVQPGMFKPGVRLVNIAGLKFPAVQNNRSGDISYWYAPQTQRNQTEFRWTRNQRLRPGRRAEIRDQSAVAVQRLRDGAPYGRFSTVPAQHRLEFWEYVTAVAAVSDKIIALGVWDEGRGRVVLRNAIDDVGEPLPHSTFHEVYCVALSPDGQYVAAAGVADVVSGAGGNRTHHTVYQIRLWSTESRELLAQVPDHETGAGRPPVGGPIANVGIFPNEVGEPAVRFAFGYLASGVRAASNVDMPNKFRPQYLSRGIEPVDPDDKTDFRTARAIVEGGATDAQGQDVLPQRVSRGRPFHIHDRQPPWLKIKLRNANGTTLTRWLKSQDAKLDKNWPRLWPALRNMKEGNEKEEPPQGTFKKEYRLNGQFQLTVSQWTMQDADGNQVGRFPVIPGNEPTCGVRFDQNGRDLVALALLDGIQIWDVDRLKAGIGRKAILRSFYGHDSKVTCLDVSPGARWLVSGSDDGTICGWSLSGLGDGNELGVTFDRTPRVTVVLPDSPGWEAGFEKGQVVTALQVAGRTVRGAQSMRQVLAEPVPGEELFVTVGGTQLMTPVSRDPLWTYYPYHDGYWLMWSPAGYFDSKSSAGLGDTEARFEWDVNLANVVQSHGRQPGVVTMRAIDFERELRSTEKLEKAAEDLVPIANNLPLVPAIDLRLDGRTARLSVTPTGGSQTIVERSLWLNGRRLHHETPVNDATLPLEIPLPQKEFRWGRNTVTSMVTVAQRSADGVHRWIFPASAVFDHRPRNRPRPRLHYVGIGVTKLSPTLASKLGLQPLDSPANDVIQVGKSLRSAARALARKGAQTGLDLREFGEGRFQVLAANADQPATKKNLLAALTELARGAKPEDLTVIMLAGHGVMQNQNGQSPDFHFVAQDALMSRTELTDRLVELPCRSLLVLDTCHSGAANAAIGSQVEGLLKLLVGPHILTACGRDEQAESASNHGVFTLALLEGIDGTCRVDDAPARDRDQNGDGIVTVEELCRFVQERTPDLIKALGLDTVKNVKQNPQILRSRSFEDTRVFPVGIR